MGNIGKGEVYEVTGYAVRVKNLSGRDLSTPLLDDGGFNLEVGDHIVYAVFPDNSGIVLGLFAEDN